MRWRILCEVERVTWGLIANVVFQLFKGNTYLSEVVLYPSTSNIYTDELRGYPSKMECLRASGHFFRARWDVYEQVDTFSEQDGMFTSKGTLFPSKMGCLRASGHFFRARWDVYEQADTFSEQAG
jgi:hypothetical protein